MSYYDHATLMALQLGPWRNIAQPRPMARDHAQARRTVTDRVASARIAAGA